MDDEDEEFAPDFPWSWKSALCHATKFAADVLADAAEFANNITFALAAACNHEINQREFREQAALEIESITTHTEE